MTECLDISGIDDLENDDLINEYFRESPEEALCLLVREVRGLLKRVRKLEKKLCSSYV